MIQDDFVNAVILAVLGTTAGIVGLLAVRKWLGVGTLAAYHDVAGSFLSVVGTLYAVLLGLVVVDSMEDFEEAGAATVQEENVLANIVLLSHQLPKAKRDDVRRRAAEYGRLVVDRDWPAMDRGRTDPVAHRPALDLVRAVFEFEPTTESEKAIYPAQVEAATQLWNSRHIRAVGCAEGIPTLEWIVLIAGGMVTVCFTYFFVVENLRVQVIMTALVALTISLNIMLVLMFGYPYSGGVKIAPPESFLIPNDMMEDTPPTRVSAVMGLTMWIPDRPSACEWLHRARPRAIRANAPVRLG